ncbi:mechanosensitive ion channel family protein [Arcobacter sp. LA11]|uniref:mechanosensitive ion channel family protein n=1 Tax=Arcobacter sp. LA11 TaxID=1898176 RepID=UPI000934922B|nr:mechanosensitive ion channel family protein [Arcobacter sp. LA11]
MGNFFFKKLFFILFIPLFLFSQEVIKEDTTQKSIDDHLKEQQLIAQEVIKDINNEKYLNEEYEDKDYEQKTNYLLSRININKRQGNFSAVKRDEIKVLLLEEKRVFQNTLIDIIYAKRSLKDKDFFVNIISNNIELLEKDKSFKYKEFYEDELTKDNKISKEFVQNYLRLTNQNSQQLFTLNYLLDNINLYRKTNFFIDKFNLQSFIKLIDSQSWISSISEFTSYNLKFSVGEIIVVLLIVVFFRLLNTRIITLLSVFINILLTKKIDSLEEKESVHYYIKKSIERPLILALYILAIKISLYILVKDTETINNIVPWINTLYMGLFTWAIYSLLTNSISNYAQHLVVKYPNVRREMIVFVLRIIKIILILLVILFLFAQLGIDIKAIAASLGVGGIAIALASKDTLTNFFGSLSIMADNSFTQGDWIKTGGVEGTVVDIRMRTTRIRTFDNAMITVPNSELANTNIKNYSKRRIGRRIKMKLGITYESSMSDIINLKNDIYEMLSNHPQIATNKSEPLDKTRKFEAIKKEDLYGVKRTLLVFIDEYDASSINILVYCFSRSPGWENWLTIKEDVLIKIHELVEKNNCEFAYPTQTLHMKNDPKEVELL